MAILIGMNLLFFEIIYATQYKRYKEYSERYKPYKKVISLASNSKKNLSYSSNSIAFENNMNKNVYVKPINSGFFSSKNIRTTSAIYYESDMTDLQSKWDEIQLSWLSLPQIWKNIKDNLIKEQKRDWTNENTKLRTLNHSTNHKRTFKKNTLICCKTSAKNKTHTLEMSIRIAFDDMINKWKNTLEIYEGITKIWDTIGIGEYYNGNWEETNNIFEEIKKEDIILRNEWRDIQRRVKAIIIKNEPGPSVIKSQLEVTEEKQDTLSAKKDQDSDTNEARLLIKIMGDMEKVVKEMKTERIIAERTIRKKIKCVKTLNLVKINTLQDYERKKVLLQDNLKLMRTLWDYCDPLWDKYSTNEVKEGHVFYNFLWECERCLEFEEDCDFTLKKESWESVIPMSLQKIKCILRSSSSNIIASRRILGKLHRNLRKSTKTLQIMLNERKSTDDVSLYSINEKVCETTIHQHTDDGVAKTVETYNFNNI